MQTGAVLLGHAAPTPVRHQPRGADTARHAVGAELWTDTASVLVPPCPGTLGGGTPSPATHAVHVQRVAAPETLSPGRARRGVVAVQVHHGGRTPCRGRQLGWEGPQPRPAEAPAPGRGGGPYLSSSAPQLPGNSASHPHTSCERQTALPGPTAHPPPRRPHPELCPEPNAHALLGAGPSEPSPWPEEGSLVTARLGVGVGPSPGSPSVFHNPPGRSRGLRV